MAERMPQELASNIYSDFVYPIRPMTERAILGTSRYILDLTSPAKTTCPVVTRVSIATRESSSHAKKLSIRASEIWSAILSGCPSDTDSEVNKYAINIQTNWGKKTLQRVEKHG